jgi:hypothetical protein
LVGSQPGKIVLETLSWKYPTHKRAGRVAQIVEHLPSKCEALSSDPNIAPPKKKVWVFLAIHTKSKSISFDVEKGAVSFHRWLARAGGERNRVADESPRWANFYERKQALMAKWSSCSMENVCWQVLLEAVIDFG